MPNTGINFSYDINFSDTVIPVRTQRTQCLDCRAAERSATPPVII